MKLGPIDLSAGIGSQSGSGTQTGSGTTTKKRVLSQEAQDKIIYDILSADRGLADILSGAGFVGGAGGSTGSTQGLMAQDFISKAVGEIALLTAEEISTTEQESTSSQKSKSSSAKTVICTELHRQGKLSNDLYNAGTPHFQSLHPWTVRGYRSWADKVVPLMQKSERLSNFLAPIAISRYLMTTGRLRFTLWGLATIYIGQPICFLIGAVLAMFSRGESNVDQRTI